MRNSTMMLVILGVVSGALIPVQAASNAALSLQIHGKALSDRQDLPVHPA